MGKAKAPPPEPPPPPPNKQAIQVSCIPWKTMNFQISTVPQYLTVAELETIVKTRHGDPIENVVFYKDDPRVAANKLGSEERLSSTKIFYDYYPHLDPFENRPNAHLVYGSNPLIDMRYTEEYEGKPSEGGAWKNSTPCETYPLPIAAWSKCAEHDPWTAARLAAEAEAEAKAAAEKAAAEAAEKAAAEEARAAAKAEKLAIKKAKQEAERAAREEEERLAKEAEMERLRKLAEADPEAAARAAALAAAEEAKAKLAALPPRAKGGALGCFLGNTAKTAYGLEGMTKESPWKLVHMQVILDEVQKNGKISDMYVMKAEIEKYDGADGEILFCLDKAELYGDNGMIVCVKDADKQHFIAHIAAGNGIPPPV